MRAKNIQIVGILFLVLTMLFATGCGPKLVVYTSIQPEMLSNTIEPAVKTALPNVEVEWFQAGTEKIIAKIAAEMAAGKVHADVLMVADPSFYIYLKSAYYPYLKSNGVLLSYNPAGAADAFGVQDPEGYYQSVRVINAVIGYNTNLVKKEDAPKRFSDLIDPKWKGKVGMPDPTLSGSALDTVAALNGKYGWDYFKALKNNGVFITDGQGTLENKLVTGEVTVALILEMNILSAKSKGEPVELVYPEDGIGVFPSPIGIIKTTDNPDAAKALVDWWFTPEGQGAISGGFMHPVRRGIAPPKGAPELTSFLDRAFPIDWAKLSTDTGKLKNNFNSIMEGPD